MKANTISIDLPTNVFQVVEFARKKNNKEIYGRLHRADINVISECYIWEKQGALRMTTILI